MHGVVVYGTRPEAIKLAPVIEQLKHRTTGTITVINTGQHDALMPHVMALFGITVDVELQVLQPGQSLGQLTSRVLEKLTNIFGVLKPDYVVVQGDTITAMAGAMAAYYCKVPVGHVEAGLRTYQLNSPFPEEADRRIIAALSAWNFAPSETAARNLFQERVAGKVLVTGNPVVDALKTIAKRTPTAVRGQTKRIVATIHRRENVPFLPCIFRALARLANEQIEVIFPVHENPAIVQASQTWLLGTGVQIIKPMDYLPWVGLLKSADLIISDSGGLQEEAPVLGIPLLVARRETERPEVITGGYGYLVGVEEEAIVEAARDTLAGRKEFRRGSPYGDGHAAERIANALTVSKRLLERVPDEEAAKKLSGSVQ